MQTAPTTRGKSYSVHSSAGCTVSDDSGWSKTLEAPEDYFTAHGGKVYIDDDAATVTELFKLAPYQQLRLLGVVGGDQLPAGYTRVAYLESTGTQYVDTRVEEPNKFSLEYSTVTTNNLRFVMGCQVANATEIFGCGAADYVSPVDGFIRNAGFSSAERHTLDYTKGANLVCYVDGQYTQALAVTAANPGTIIPAEPLTMYLFGAHTGEGFWRGETSERIFGCKFWNSAGTLLGEFIPALDSTGTPCMYDTVTRTPIYNSGRGAFIAGVEKQSQLTNLLRKLPDRTGQDVGTLTVRLADELQTPENESKLEAMAAKNWEISQAA